MSSDSTLIDVDEQDTWPAHVKAAVRQTEKRLRPLNRRDREIGPEDDDAFRASLSPHRLQAYHATRLLPHEEESVRRQGLRALTPELLADRLSVAHTHGAITAEQRDLLATANVFHERHVTEGARRGTVCLFLGRRLLDEDTEAVWPLITTWGGEGIYMSSKGYALRPMLKTLGVPTIVAVAVDLSAGWRTHLVSPGVLHCFVSDDLGLSDLGADVHYRASIPAEQILDVWQPGHPEFDRHTELLAAV